MKIDTKANYRIITVWFWLIILNAVFAGMRVAVLIHEAVAGRGSGWLYFWVVPPLAAAVFSVHMRLRMIAHTKKVEAFNMTQEDRSYSGSATQGRPATPEEVAAHEYQESLKKFHEECATLEAKYVAIMKVDTERITIAQAALAAANTPDNRRGLTRAVGYWRDGVTRFFRNRPHFFPYKPNNPNNRWEFEALFGYTPEHDSEYSKTLSALIECARLGDETLSSAYGPIAKDWSACMEEGNADRSQVEYLFIQRQGNGTLKKFVRERGSEQKINIVFVPNK